MSDSPASAAGDRRVVLASGNSGKLREMRDILSGTGMALLPLGEFTGESPEETGLTFVENALLKARFAARVSGLPALADDSGLVVEALGGAPGVRSARYAGACANDQANVRLLLDNLNGFSGSARRARFYCAMVWLEHHRDPVPLVAQAAWEGEIGYEPAGDNGFGYDPVFYVPELGCTAAELSAEKKNRLSHRGQALQALLGQLLETGRVR